MNIYARGMTFTTTENPRLFDDDWKVTDLAADSSFVEKRAGFQKQVVSPTGTIYQGDSTAWLKTLEPGSVDLVFADPPYNIGKASWDSFPSHDQYVEWTLDWMEDASRALTMNGSLYICGFTEILADIKHPAMKNFADCRWLIWHYKNKANLGSDWGRSHESIVHFRKSKSTRLLNPDFARVPYGAHTLKYPSHPQAETSNFARSGAPKRDNWEPHSMGAKAKDVIEIPTTSNGMAEKTPHPTQKPEELIRKFVAGSSNAGDMVIDPFSGSGTTAVVSEQLGRRWAACDLEPEYNTWASERLHNVRRMDAQAWFDYDRSIATRRESIR